MNKEKDINEQTFIPSTHDVEMNSGYASWLSDLKGRYQAAQIKAAVKVNSEKLFWNWQLGRDLVERRAEETWGTGVVEQLSLDLQAAFPKEKGFSARNIWHMKQWYEFYSQKLKQLVSELRDIDIHNNIKLSQLGSEITDEPEVGCPFPSLFAYIPWGHHVEILKKCRSVEEALYYIYRTIEEGWSRSTLINCLKADLYHGTGKAITNFAEKLPEMQARLAQEITKENYDFGFLTLPKEYDESELENALATQITRFLLELGSGFAYIGRQVEVVVAGKSRRIDMLFYHIQLRAYIVCELKAVPFEPEFAGKLNFYVTAVNKLMKTDRDNPTIGLLICSDLNETEVQWSFETINAPIGVASYSNVQIDELKKCLPSEMQLKQRIQQLEKEIKKLKRNSSVRTDELENKI